MPNNRRHVRELYPKYLEHPQTCRRKWSRTVRILIMSANRSPNFSTTEFGDEVLAKIRQCISSCSMSVYMMAQWKTW